MIRLGFDVYSVRAFQWKAMQLIDYAAGLKLDTLQISSVGDYESLDPEHLTKVKTYAEAKGLKLEGGTGCICPTSTSYNPKSKDPIAYITEGLRVAHAVGATSMRCFLGSRPDRFANGPIEKHMESTIKVFRAVRSQALDLNVKIALENHNGDLQAREVKTIIEESGKDFVGSNLDTGNPMILAEDPLVTLDVLGPYVVTTHIRDSVVYEHPNGCAFQWVALGDGMIDWKAFLARFVEVCPNAPMQLEIITGRPPQVVPYLDGEFWKAFPHANAAEFARYVALVKRGRPFEKFMVIEDGAKPLPPEYAAALKEQQRVDLERSLEFAKRSLDVGIRWRENSKAADKRG
jgi:sugar phosphate isomerase/epimerase